jgi:hypothetical protein
MTIKIVSFLHPIDKQSFLWYYSVNTGGKCGRQIYWDCFGYWSFTDIRQWHAGWDHCIKKCLRRPGFCTVLFGYSQIHTPAVTFYFFVNPTMLVNSRNFYHFDLYIQYSSMNWAWFVQPMHGKKMQTSRSEIGFEAAVSNRRVKV